MHDDQTRRARSLPRRRSMAIGVALLFSVATIGSAVVDAQGARQQQRQQSDVMEQGGGDAYQRNGARLTRTDHSVEVTWKIRTPGVGTYTYPTPDMVLPGAPPHPPIEPGYPEVFTLWMFVFDYPELCTGGACNSDDIGDTAARGSVYQLDGAIAYHPLLRMGGKARIGQTPLNGLGLANPLGAEVHVAMAPHGTALDGADLVRQLNSPVGGPPLWFAAIFLPA